MKEIIMLHIAGAYAKSSLTNIQRTDIQPNACDLRLDRVFMPRGGEFTITNDSKEHLVQDEILPDKNDDFFTLYPGYYTVEYENQITVGEKEAGFVIARSTLVRNGVYITTGLYDSGYRGKMVSGMHVTTGTMRIKRGTRIAQYLCFDAESLNQYNGDYQSR
jgi:deoxycytidine triphosphate deaminase